MTIKKYLSSAAKAWANANLNIQKFADNYVAAVLELEDEAREAFKAAYPMFGKREWHRFWLVGTNILLPQFMFKSDSFVCKLLKLKDHMKWQFALVSASEDGTLRVDRGHGPESVKLSELTKKEEKTLAMLLSDNDSKLSPIELLSKFESIMRKINKTRGKNRKRRPREILDDLSDEVVKYSHLRDEEWNFAWRHGNREGWDRNENREYNKIHDEIQKSRNKLTKLVREATGDNNIDV